MRRLVPRMYILLVTVECYTYKHRMQKKKNYRYIFMTIFVYYFVIFEKIHYNKRMYEYIIIYYINITKETLQCGRLEDELL